MSTYQLSSTDYAGIIITSIVTAGALQPWTKITFTMGKVQIAVS
jgi:hypothetical protein